MPGPKAILTRQEVANITVSLYEKFGAELANVNEQINSLKTYITNYADKRIYHELNGEYANKTDGIRKEITKNFANDDWSLELMVAKVGYNLLEKESYKVANMKPDVFYEVIKSDFAMMKEMNITMQSYENLKGGFKLYCEKYVKDKKVDYEDVFDKLTYKDILEDGRTFFIGDYKLDENRDTADLIREIKRKAKERTETKRPDTIYNESVKKLQELQKKQAELQKKVDDYKTLMDTMHEDPSRNLGLSDKDKSFRYYEMTKPFEEAKAEVDGIIEEARRLHEAQVANESHWFLYRLVFSGRIQAERERIANQLDSLSNRVRDEDKLRAYVLGKQEDAEANLTSLKNEENQKLIIYNRDFRNDLNAYLQREANDIDNNKNRDRNSEIGELETAIISGQENLGRITQIIEDKIENPLMAPIGSEELKNYDGVIRSEFQDLENWKKEEHDVNENSPFNFFNDNYYYAKARLLQNVIDYVKGIRKENRTIDEKAFKTIATTIYGNFALLSRMGVYDEISTIELSDMDEVQKNILKEEISRTRLYFENQIVKVYNMMNKEERKKIDLNHVTINLEIDKDFKNALYIEQNNLSDTVNLYNYVTQLSNDISDVSGEREEILDDSKYIIDRESALKEKARTYIGEEIANRTQRYNQERQENRELLHMQDDQFEDLGEIVIPEERIVQHENVIINENNEINNINNENEGLSESELNIDNVKEY